MQLKPGLSHTYGITVSKEMLASHWGSGLVDVYATPMMIAHMEYAALKCIEPCLEAGQVSVGGHVNVSHIAATPLGMRVTAEATVTAIDRRRVDFTVTMRDECGEIGSGTHTRFIVDEAAFIAKTNAKKS